MAGLKWNTGKLYYSTVELGNQQIDFGLFNLSRGGLRRFFGGFSDFGRKCRSQSQEM